MHKASKYALIFVVGFIGVSLISFFLVTHPREITFDRTPNDFDLSPQEVTLTTTDNVSISGWYLPSEESPNKALLLLHGYPANKHDLLSTAKDLYPEFSLLLIDLRYFGESGGGATTFGIDEQKDVRAAIDFLSEKGYEHIGVFGYSLGGALALTAAKDDRVSAAASYGAFANLRALAYEQYKYLFIFKYPLVELLNVWSRIFFGQWVFTSSPVETIAHIENPLFIGHARNDDIIPFHHAQILADVANTDTLTTFFPSVDYHNVLPLGLTHELTIFFKGAFTE